MILRTIRQCFALLDPVQRRRWLRLIPLIVTAGVLEMAGASGIFVLIRLLTDPFAVHSITWLDWLRAPPVSATEAQLAPMVAVLVAVLFLLKNGLRLFEAYQRQLCAENSSTELVSRMLGLYLRAPYSFHLGRSPVDLSRNIERSVEEVSVSCLPAVTIIASEGVIGLGLLVVLVWVASVDALVVAAVLGLVTVAFLIGFQKPIAMAGVRVHETNEAKLALLRFSFDSVREIRLFSAVEHFVERLRQIRSEQGDALVRYGTISWVPRLIVESLFVCGIAGLVYRTSSGVGEAWRLAPTVGIFAYGALRLLPSFYLMVYHAGRIQNGTAAVAEVYRDYLSLRDLPVERSGRSSAGPKTPFADALRLSSVTYTYPDADKPALRAVHLEVPRGGSLGIIGSTGAGKSTLLSILLGLLEPDSGTYTIDGSNVSADPVEWRRRLGYVPQEISLMDASIRENIAFGIESAAIDEAAVERAVDQAHLRSTVEALPEGLDTRVGDRGMRLSGGQRQRVAIARALYRRAEILIFDEATSSLDDATERALLEVIEGLRGNTTMIIVAHRMKMVAHCDHVVVLEDGVIAREGTQADLERSFGDVESGDFDA